MSTAQAINVEEAVWKPAVNPWIIGVVVSLAAFMEVLDTSIANVALPHIAGNLGASNDESTWVLTSYLAANAIVLPITGWLTQVFGRKRFFMLCIAMFTASSFFCGIAPSLGLLLLFRVLQGAFGGGLQPMAQAILADTFPPKQRGLHSHCTGAPPCVVRRSGPLLAAGLRIATHGAGSSTSMCRWGSWLCYSYTNWWRTRQAPAKRASDLSRFDYLGFSLLAIGIAALQIVLDKGQEVDWFGSHFIMALSITAVVCLTALIIWQWRQNEPIVDIDIRLFKNLNFATSNLMMFIVGIVLYASSVLVP